MSTNIPFSTQILKARLIIRNIALLFFVCTLPLAAAHAQSTTATLSGTVIDQNGAIVPGAEITIVNTATSLQREVTSDEQGAFVVPLLSPGAYQVRVRREGFSPLEIPGVVLNVGDQKSLQIQLKAGDVNAQVTVDSSAETIRTDASVTTVIDRKFVSEIPLNGRTFQSLIALTPGVVIAPVSPGNNGQFSVNGQRTSTNYFQVDGVSANFGINTSSANPQGFAGAMPALTTAGGTNGLVSVDALQEFKVQTSTYAPEFGRMSGAQIQILTRSGGNQFHGSIFEYFRNDALDANDWFANQARLKRAPLRQSDFGGTFSGPVILPRFGEGGRQPGYDGHDRLFFFFSYEGLRLRQPQANQGQVPSLALRASAGPAMRPVLEGFSRPNGAELVNPLTGQPTGMALFTANYSDQVRLNATSVRLDYKASSKMSLFGRFDESPSTSEVRQAPFGLANTVVTSDLGLRTITAGVELTISPRLFNEFRFNYSQQRGTATYETDTFGGAVPPAASTIFVSTMNPRTDTVQIRISPPGGNAGILQGVDSGGRQRQIQLTDATSVVVGGHTLKFGGDWRVLHPRVVPRGVQAIYFFLSIPNIQNGITTAFLNRNAPSFPVLHNLSLFAQDAWAITPRLKVTYGLRWDLNPPPSFPAGEEPVVIQGTASPTTYRVAPRGTPLYPTLHTNFAPRVGLAYRLRENTHWGTTLRGGVGLFYDLGSDDSLVGVGEFPFVAKKRLNNVQFPLQAADATLPAFATSFPTPFPQSVDSYADDFATPRIWQWSATIDQELGGIGALEISYIGSHGEHQLVQDFRIAPNDNFEDSITIRRTIGTSDYHGLQAQYTRRLSRGFQAYAAYTWSKAIDEASESFGTFALVRGPTDFDTRHVLSTALTYELPHPHRGLLNDVIGGWNVSLLGRVQSAAPLNIIATNFVILNGTVQALRPNLLTDVPVYIHHPSLPGGKAINFTTDPSRPGCVGPFCNPAPDTQGNLGRNVIRGFGASQIDLAVKRRFSLREKVALSLSLEAFNVLNHPNFGPPNGSMTSGQFGRPSAMLGRSLGGLSPIYQIGGPRSMQLSVRLQF
jgi:hypothetical protein